MSDPIVARAMDGWSEVIEHYADLAARVSLHIVQFRIEFNYRDRVNLRVYSLDPRGAGPYQFPLMTPCAVGLLIDLVSRRRPTTAARLHY